MKADDLVTVLKSCPQSVAAWAVGLSARSFRDRHVPRLESGAYDLQVVVKYIVRSAADEALGVASDQDSDELRRWRAARAAAAELDFAERLRELQSASVVDAWVDRCLSVMRQWSERIAPDHPTITRSYQQAVRHATSVAETLVRPAHCRTVLQIHPDRGDPFTIDLGHIDEEVTLPPLDERDLPRICPKCNGEMEPSWLVNLDETEEPIWHCRTMNCPVRISRKET